jgi:hypothetical protein
MKSQDVVILLKLVSLEQGGAHPGGGAHYEDEASHRRSRKMIACTSIWRLSMP